MPWGYELFIAMSQPYHAMRIWIIHRNVSTLSCHEDFYYSSQCLNLIMPWGFELFIYSEVFSFCRCETWIEHQLPLIYILISQVLCASNRLLVERDDPPFRWTLLSCFLSLMMNQCPRTPYQPLQNPPPSQPRKLKEYREPMTLLLLPQVAVTAPSFT